MSWTRELSTNSIMRSFVQKYSRIGFHRDSAVMNEGTLGDPGGVALHWIITACAGVLLVAACHFEGLPLRLNWPLLIKAFWGGMTVGAIFAATLLYLIGFPLSQTVKPVWMHYKQQKARIPIFLVFATWMVLHFGVVLGGIIVFDGL